MYKLAIAAVVLTLVSSVVGAQTFQVSSQSGYVYFPSPFLPIPGCQPNEFRCDFGVSGTLEIVDDGSSLSFIAAALQLSGNEAIQNDPQNGGLVTGAGVSDYMVNDLGAFSFFSDDGTTRVYQRPGFEVRLTGDHLRLVGGFDSRPVDGPGLMLDLATHFVPESGTSPLALWFCAACALGKRRGC